MAYTTTAKVKAFTRILYSDLRAMDTTTFDTLIGTLIDTATAAMDTYCDRDFDLHSADARIYDVGANDQRTIEINGPVITLTKVEVRDSPGDSWSTMDSEYYVHRNHIHSDDEPRGNAASLIRVGFGMFALGRMTRYMGYAYGGTRYKRTRNLWIRGYQNVRVTSTWGYSTVPSDIDAICILLVDHWLQNLVRLQVSKKSDIMDPEKAVASVQYDIPANIRARLDMWRNIKNRGVI